MLLKFIRTPVPSFQYGAWCRMHLLTCLLTRSNLSCHPGASLSDTDLSLSTLANAICFAPKALHRLCLHGVRSLEYPLFPVASTGPQFRTQLNVIRLTDLNRHLSCLLLRVTVLPRLKYPQRSFPCRGPLQTHQQLVLRILYGYLNQCLPHGQQCP
jgi:hypothetical protein